MAAAKAKPGEIAYASLGVGSTSHLTMEAIKLVAGLGQASRMQIFDALRAEWRAVKVAKDPACGVCSV